MRVQVFLDDGETIDSAHELLQKAMQKHVAGQEHKSAFHQPSARDVFNRMIKEHDKMWVDILKEIDKVIDDHVFDRKMK